MDYAEASYFNGAHFQHIADWLEARRINRRRIESMQAAGVRGR